MGCCNLQNPRSKESVSLPERLGGKAGNSADLANIARLAANLRCKIQTMPHWFGIVISLDMFGF